MVRAGRRPNFSCVSELNVGPICMHFAPTALCLSFYVLHADGIFNPFEAIPLYTYSENLPPRPENVC